MPNLVCVGAIDARAAFSNDGTASVDLCAQPAARKAATVRRVRVAGRPRVCRRCGCQARTATLSFVLSAEAGVIARLQRHRCVRTRCRCPARERTRHLAAGTTRWTVGQQLLGMPLRRGTRRLTLATSDSTARREVPRPLADAWRPI